MKLFDSVRLRIATLFRRSQMNAEIEQELRSHIQHRTDDLERSGLDRAEAERRTRCVAGHSEGFGGGAGGFPRGRRRCSLTDTLRRNRKPHSVPMHLRYPVSLFFLIKLHSRRFGS